MKWNFKKSAFHISIKHKIGIQAVPHPHKNTNMPLMNGVIALRNRGGLSTSTSKLPSTTAIAAAPMHVQ